jgi:hypothetical protein
MWPSPDFVYTKNRDHILKEQLMAHFLELLLAAPEVKVLLSSEHFSVDGTLLRAWASHSSLERIDGLDDGRHHPMVARALAVQAAARNVPKVTSAACCLPIRAS